MWLVRERLCEAPSNPDAQFIDTSETAPQVEDRTATCKVLVLVPQVRSTIGAIALSPPQRIVFSTLGRGVNMSRSSMVHDR